MNSCPSRDAHVLFIITYLYNVLLVLLTWWLVSLVFTMIHGFREVLKGKTQLITNKETFVDIVPRESYVPTSAGGWWDLRI